MTPASPQAAATMTLQHNLCTFAGLMVLAHDAHVYKIYGCACIIVGAKICIMWKVQGNMAIDAGVDEDAQVCRVFCQACSVQTHSY
jgi:hypothetical protein